MKKGEPAWEVARLFPAQGHWSPEDYSSLDTNHFVEYSQGRIDVLPMPTTSHQGILGYLCIILKNFVADRNAGESLIGPLPIRIMRREFRQPDIFFVLKENARFMGERYLKGIDLAMEIVSAGVESRRRDLKEKRRNYAKAGIPEYWIVDPRLEKITVLKLEGKTYTVHGDFSRRQGNVAPVAGIRRGRERGVRQPVPRGCQIRQEETAAESVEDAWK